MSLHVAHLTKLYGWQKAVDDITFAIGTGEIVGFLGPNGAGKSTTMKLITGYLAPSFGEVKIEGLDVRENPLAVKKMIGYLPEHNPLYLDMYLHEYLQFVGSIHKIPGKQLLSRIEEMIALCGLHHEQHKKLESLSKGYRQRVGLAQALLHDPRVLILDEPTSGLDPNQLIEVRKVIKAISSHKTVLFSSHIMQEVEALCDRVMVINQGKIVADDQLQNLLEKGHHQHVLWIEFQDDIPVDELKNLPGIAEVVALSARKFKLLARAGRDVRGELFRYASEKGRSLVELRVEENTMESVFKQLTSTDPA